MNLGSGAITLLFKIKSATADENQGERTPQPRPTHFRYTHVNGTNLSDLTLACPAFGRCYSGLQIWSLPFCLTLVSFFLLCLSGYSSVLRISSVIRRHPFSTSWNLRYGEMGSVTSFVLALRFANWHLPCFQPRPVFEWLLVGASNFKCDSSAPVSTSWNLRYGEMGSVTSFVLAYALQTGIYPVFSLGLFLLRTCPMLAVHPSVERTLVRSSKLMRTFPMLAVHPGYQRSEL